MGHVAAQRTLKTSQSFCVTDRGFCRAPKNEPVLLVASALQGVVVMALADGDLMNEETQPQPTLSEAVPKNPANL